MTNKQKLFATTAVVLGLFLTSVKFSMVGAVGAIPILGDFMCLLEVLA